MLVFIILVIGISLLILIHELGHFLAAKWAGLLVEEFGFGFPPRLWSKKIGETVYSINALPFGGFVKIYGEQSDPKKEEERTGEQRKRSFSHQGAGVRAIIIAAGVIMNFIIGWFVISSLFMIGSETQAIIVSRVLPGSPAAIAGVVSGDLLLDFKQGKEFVEFVSQSKGIPKEFRVQRGTEQFTVTMTPRTEIPPGEGALGVEFTESGFPKLPFFQSIWQGLRTSVLMTGEIFKSLLGLITRIFVGGPVLKDLVGPIGIFRVANQAADVGMFWLIQLIALISLNLAVLNIFPFPALDGGRLLFLIVEKIKGSPISPQKEGIANAIGFALLIILMIVVTVKDVVGLF